MLGDHWSTTEVQDPLGAEHFLCGDATSGLWKEGQWCYPGAKRGTWGLLPARQLACCI